MATIPTHSQSYINPQQAFKQSFVSYSEQRHAGMASMSKNLMAVGSWLEKENASQKALVAEQSATQLDMYSKIDSLPTFGEDFNIRQEQYFDSKVDDYLDIKNRIESGKLTPREGNKELAKINRLLTNYKTIAPQVLALANEVKSRIMTQPGKKGAISGLVPTHVQKVLLDMLDGKDVGLVDKDGIMFLYEPGVGYINLNELTLAETKKTNSFLKFVPEYNEFLMNATKATFGDFDKGSFREGMVTIEKSRDNEGNEVTIRRITENQETLAYKSIIENNLLMPLVDNYDYMSVIWNDVVPDSIKGNYVNTAWHDPAELNTIDADNFMKEQDKIALEFLTKEAIDNYVKEGGMERGRVTNVSDPDAPAQRGDVEKKIRSYYSVFNNVDGDTPVNRLIQASKSDKITGAEIIPFVEFKTYANYTGDQAVKDALRGAKDTDLIVPRADGGYALIKSDGMTNEKAFKDLLRVLGFSGTNIDLYTKNLKFN